MKSVRVFVLAALALLAAVPLAWGQNPGDVVITEVMYDDTASTDQEWVEIYNTTAAPIDLSGWALLDAGVYPGPGSEGFITVPAGTMLAVGQYLVLAKVAIPEFEGEVVCVQTGSWTLGNSGDNLALYTATGTLIDGSLTVQYPDEATGGNSVEKCNLLAWSGNPNDWHECTNVFNTVGRYRLCTPGVANTPCPDLTPPAISSITVVNSTSLNVLFNEIVEQLTAETEANYVVTPGGLVPLTATRDAVNFALVHLTFAPLAENGYTLTVNGVADLAGNPCVNATGTFSITDLTGDVVINEVMYDDTASTDLEWVEIHNTTAAPIDISHWVLTDAPAYPVATEGGLQVPPGTTLPANGYLVLTRDPITEFAGAVVCAQYRGSWGLGNGGDNLALFTDSTGGQQVDGVVTSDALQYYPDLAAGNAGVSIEKCNENDPWSPAASAWHASVNVFATAGRYRYATPGVANSSCVVDTEPPTIASAAAVSETQVDVTFTEAIDLVTGQTATNYVVDNAVGSPVSAARQANYAVIRLTFAAPLAPNAYVLTVSNVTDLAGNVIAASSTAPFTVVEPPANIIFTELMPNPNFGGLADSLGEWFEIYNAGATPVDMAGWVIADPAGADTIEGPAVINPGQYFVFCSNATADSNGGVPEDYAYHFGTSGWGISLNNTSDSLALKDAAGTLVTGLRYTVNFGWSEGRSAQLRSLTYNPAIDTSWCRADTVWAGANNNDHGTPGQPAYCSADLPGQFYTLCDLREQDECGVPNLDGRRVITQGVVTYTDSCRRNAYIQAGNCAMLIYGNAVRYNMINAPRRMQEGDLVQVDGYLKLFRGLSEIDSSFGLVPQITLLTPNSPLPAPSTLLPSQIDMHVSNCAAEPFESRHVVIPNMRFLAGDGVATFAAATNYLAVSGPDTIQFRTGTIACDTLVGQLIPSDTVDVNGVLQQFDNSSCYCSGYQVLTGRMNPFAPAVCSTPVALTVIRNGNNNSAVLRWQPGANQTCDCFSVYYTMDAAAVFPNGYTYLNTVVGATQYIDTDPFAPRRIYVVTAGGTNCP